MSRVTRFFRCTFSDQLLVLEALAWLCWAKLLLRVVPFRWVTPRLGQSRLESSQSVSPQERRVAVRIVWAVQGVAWYAPVRFVCLPKAIATKWMLRRRRLPSTLYIGVQRREQDRMTAHAWVRVGEEILVGGEEVAGHQTVAMFGEAR